MFQQRASVPKAEARPGRRLWAPPRVRVKPRREDAYVVVDDIAGSLVVLSVSPWPRLTAKGRLVFAQGPRAGRAYAPRRALDRALGAARTRHSQTQRPVRIGDTFLVRRLDPDHPEDSGDFVDVTAAAREAAKVALYSAAAAKVTPRQLARVKTRTPARPGRRPLPPGSVAGPVV